MAENAVQIEYISDLTRAQSQYEDWKQQVESTPLNVPFTFGNQGPSGSPINAGISGGGGTVGGPGAVVPSSVGSGVAGNAVNAGVSALTTSISSLRTAIEALAGSLRGGGTGGAADIGSSPVGGITGSRPTRRSSGRLSPAEETAVAGLRNLPPEMQDAALSSVGFEPDAEGRIRSALGRGAPAVAPISGGGMAVPLGIAASTIFGVAERATQERQENQDTGYHGRYGPSRGGFLDRSDTGSRPGYNRHAGGQGYTGAGRYQPTAGEPFEDVMQNEAGGGYGNEEIQAEAERAYRARDGENGWNNLGPRRTPRQGQTWGQWFGKQFAPSKRMYFQSLFGAWEVANASRFASKLQSQTLYSDDPAQAAEQSATGLSQITSGIFGGIAGFGADVFMTQGPSRIEDMARGSAWYLQNSQENQKTMLQTTATLNWLNAPSPGGRKIAEVAARGASEEEAFNLQIFNQGQAQANATHSGGASFSTSEKLSAIFNTLSFGAVGTSKEDIASYKDSEIDQAWEQRGRTKSVLEGARAATRAKNARLLREAGLEADAFDTGQQTDIDTATANFGASHPVRALNDSRGAFSKAYNEAVAHGASVPELIRMSTLQHQIETNLIKETNDNNDESVEQLGFQHQAAVAVTSGDIMAQRTANARAGGAKLRKQLIKQGFSESQASDFSTQLIDDNVRAAEAELTRNITGGNIGYNSHLNALTALYNRDPFGAERAAIQGRFDEGEFQSRGLPGGLRTSRMEVLGAVRDAEFAANRRREEETGVRTNFSLQGSLNQARILASDQGTPYSRHLAAQADSVVFGAAETAAGALDRLGDTAAGRNAAGRAFGIGQAQLASLRRSYLDSFDAKQMDLSQVFTGAGGGGENPADSLKAIAEAAKKLEAIPQKMDDIQKMMERLMAAN